jgi:hypothetical protein
MMGTLVSYQTEVELSNETSVRVRFDYLYGASRYTTDPNSPMCEAPREPMVRIISAVLLDPIMGEKAEDIPKLLQEVHNWPEDNLPTLLDYALDQLCGPDCWGIA